MLRFFYSWIIRFHPARFRERFAEEMLSIFDHIEGRAAAAELVADAFISLVRQWTMRSEYWEEKATVSVQAGVGGFPVLYTSDSFTPRKSALIEGAVLTWIVYSALFFGIRHGKIHTVYVPSVQFESADSSAVQLATNTPSLPPRQGNAHPRTQAIIEAGTISPKQDRLRLRKGMPSETDSSAHVSESQKQAGLTPSDRLDRTISSNAPVQPLSQLVVPANISKEALFSYLGVYTTDAPNTLTVFIMAEDGQLVIKIPGEQDSKLVHVHGMRFAFSEAQNNWVEFMKPDKGVVYSLRIYRNGSEFRGHRKAKLLRGRSELKLRPPKEKL